MLREGNFCQFKNVDSDVVENIQKEGIKSYKETGLGVQAESLQTQQLVRTVEASYLGLSEEELDSLLADSRIVYFGLNNSSQVQ